MKKIILIVLGVMLFTQSWAQISKIKSGANLNQQAKINTQNLLKNYSNVTLGSIFKKNPDVFNQLTEEEKAKFGQLLDGPAKDLFNSKLYSMRTPSWWRTLFANVSKDDFGIYHPCAIAISKKGKVAISTYEGDEAIGKVFVWSNFASFKAGNKPTYNFDILDPEGLAFDSKEGLFIASTFQGQISYISNFNFQPDISYYIDENRSNPTNWNPRGLAVDANDNLYAMCENVYNWPSIHKSIVVKVTNPSSANPTKTPLAVTLQDQNHALGLAIKNNVLVTAGFFSQTLNVFDITNNALIKRSIVHTDYSSTMDVALDDPINGITYAYYNNEGGFLVKWNIAEPIDNNATNVNIGGFTNWGVAIYGNFIISANAQNHKVIITDKTTDFK